MDTQSQIYGILKKIENEIQDLKILIISNQTEKFKQTVSLKGIAKLLVSEDELNKSITSAKKSLSKGVDNVLCS